MTDAFADFVVGHGELWCAQLFAATVRREGVDAAFMDTRDVLVVTCPDGKSVDVEYAASEANLDAWGRDHGVPQVLMFLGVWNDNPNSIDKIRIAENILASKDVNEAILQNCHLMLRICTQSLCRVQNAESIWQGCIGASPTLSALGHTRALRWEG